MDGSVTEQAPANKSAGFNFLGSASCLPAGAEPRELLETGNLFKRKISPFNSPHPLCAIRFNQFFRDASSERSIRCLSRSKELIELNQLTELDPSPLQGQSDCLAEFIPSSLEGLAVINLETIGIRPWSSRFKRLTTNSLGNVLLNQRLIRNLQFIGFLFKP